MVLKKTVTRYLKDVLNQAGFKTFILEDIRAENWLKAMGNLTFNPVSALTHSTLLDICQFQPARELIGNMMTECREVACRLGVEIRLSNERRIDGAEKVGRHKTSMLQDIEAGKALELEGLIGAVIEMAQLTGVEVTNIKTVYTLVQLLDHVVQTFELKIKAEHV